ncbi:MAG: hypothetical protein IPP94_11675 [Ignavibacteria bacterium]|nr:hypothetical protein [Ignavibacteria bacterium]
MSRSITLSTLADRGVWISHDRVNALVTAGDAVVSEIGYHGMQPVSRNSRIFAQSRGVLTIRLSHDGEHWVPFVIDTVAWSPGSILIEPRLHGGLGVELLCLERSLSLVFSNAGSEMISIDVRFEPFSLMGDVQGDRAWREAQVDGNRLLLACEDTLQLDAWLRRSGPYAGDFLIPETWRRAVFARPLRSGFATPDDLRDWARDAPLPVYTAAVHVALGGHGFTCEQRISAWHFQAVLPADTKLPRVFEVRFSDAPFSGDALMEMREWKHAHPPVAPARVIAVPALRLHGYPEIEAFFSTVPALVDSCLVRDAGMPRACPGAYYWIWSWDSIVTAMEFPRWGALRDMRAVITFINAHRDADGRIPGRWTRDFLPLDTPYRGGLEFLFAQLVAEYTAHSGDLQPLLNTYPHLLAHFDAMAAISSVEGLFANYGFYPDLPARFGRGERSAVAMEVAAHFCFCMLLERFATRLGDPFHAAAARAHAERIRAVFLDTFLDSGTGLLADAVDIDSRARNETYPLFTLLCLQSSDAVALFGDRLPALAAAIAKHHLTLHGVALVPAWDRNRQSEPAMQTWYPHWDLYALKLFRRAGDAGAIMRWLGLAEGALAALGCCPEFLALPPFERGDADAWTKHGALSNLNCVTGWYRALIEAVLGLRLDGGGMEIIPCALPIPDISLSTLRHRGSTWDVTVRHGGPALRSLRVDGIDIDLEPCAVPESCFDGTHHTLEIIYA